MTALDDWISDLLAGKYSDNDQNLISRIQVAVAALQYIEANLGGSGTGTVTSVGLALPAIFNVTGSPVTVAGTLTGSFVNQAGNAVFAGPASGGPAAPTFRSLVAADLPLATALLFGAVKPDGSTITIAGGVISASSGAGTVSSVGLALPAIFNVTGSPVTGAGTLTGALVNQNANLFFSGPTTGGAATPGFRAIVPADLPVATVAALGVVQPDGTTITVAGGVISAVSGGAGTVTSVGLALGGGVFTVSGSPVTTIGTLTGTLANQAANAIFAGPSSGAAAAPTFRSLAAADVPALPYVSSVALSAPSIFSVSGSPVTGIGTLGFSLNTQTANLVFAGPASGGAVAPTFRGLAPADLPIATAAALGAVQVDGTSITITGGGIISSTGGSGGQSPVNYVVGNWYWGLPCTVTSAGGAVTATVIRWCPVVIYDNVTLKNITGRITTAGTTNLQFAIYASGANGFATGAPLATTVNVVNTSGTIVSGAVNVALTPGLYWFGVMSGDATMAMMGIASSNSVEAFTAGANSMANLSSGGAAAQTQYSTTGTTFGTWPTNPATAISTGAISWLAGFSL